MKGDLLIFRQNMFHRHICDESENLHALWFQIIGRTSGKAEKIIVNTEFLDDNKEILSFLSEGQRINYSNPNTSLKDLPIQQLFLISIKSIVIVFIKLISKFKKFTLRN